MQERSDLKKKLFKAFKPALIWLIVFILLTLFVNVVVYEGFFVGTPSSATFVKNFDDFERVKTWKDLKSMFPALDPQNIPQWHGILVNVTPMTALEDFNRPKKMLLFNVKIQTDLDKRWLKLPSILVLLLDQNDRIRGKLYVQQTSEDSFLTGKNDTEYTFWFSIPSNMRGQNYRIVVELYGVVGNTREIHYERIKSPQYFYGTPQPFLDYEDYYGGLPSWYYSENNENRYLEFLAFNQFEAYIPSYISIFGLASYAWLLAGILSTFSLLMVLTRKWIKAYWKRNSIYVTFAGLFVIFFLALFVIIVLTH